MEFRLSEQQEMIRQMAADFAANEIVPYCADWDHRREVPLGALAKIQELGFYDYWGPTGIWGRWIG